MKILTIDDDPTRQEEFQSIFSEVYPDWEVHIAWSAEEALKAFAAHEFDLAFFDHDLGYHSENGSWIAFQVLNNPEEYHYPKKVWIHTNNPMGAKNIYAKFASAKIWADVQSYDYELLGKLKNRKEFEELLFRG